MKILLTGAAGRLGHVVLQSLRAAGHEVVATDRSADKHPDDALQFVNLLDLAEVQKLCVGIDALVHIANHPNSFCASPDVVFNENVSMNMNVFLAATQAGARRIIYASSVQAMSGRRKFGTDQHHESQIAYLPADGDLPQNPGSTYALSKCVGEQQLKYLIAGGAATSAFALRFPALVSRHGFAHWRDIESKPENVNRHTLIDELFTWLSFNDAAALIDSMLKSPITGYRCYFPTHPRPRLNMSVPEIVTRFFPNVPLRHPVETMQSLIDLSAITRETGWSPQDNFWDVPS